MYYVKITFMVKNNTAKKEVKYMSKSYVLYNLKAGNKTALEDISVLETKLEGESELIDVVGIKDYKE
jgi:hypothetical protein